MLMPVLGNGKQLVYLFAFVGTLLALEATAHAQFIGKFCFKFDNFGDIYNFRVEQMGDVFQLTGNDPAYLPERASLNGGGYIDQNIFYGHIIHARIGSPGSEGPGRRGIFVFNINLATLKGRTIGAFTDPNGANPTPINEPFSKINCPAAQEASTERTSD
jgi:hypothetical protein